MENNNTSPSLLTTPTTIIAELTGQQGTTPESLSTSNYGDEIRLLNNSPTTTATINSTISHMNGAAAGTGSGLNNITNNSEVGVIGGGVGANRLSKRRPQTQTSMEQQQPQQQQSQQPQPQQQQKVMSSPQYLTLTIHKDSVGYGMKVSGDNPVYVQSVHPGGAAHKAGLIPGDMILKVNGAEVRSEKHNTVCALIKSHTVVEVTVKRSQKMQRPTSVGIPPSTPLLPRDRTASITGPQPVDNAMRKEMEFHKIKTLQLMLEQEKKNLENLKSSSNSSSNRQDRARAEATIRKLQEQLRQVGGEDASLHFLTTSPTTLITTPPNPSIHHHHHHQLATTPQPQPTTSPAFLSRFPRSLSSLSLGTKKKNDKDLTSPLNNLLIQPPPKDLIITTPSPSSHLNPSLIPTMIPTTPLTHHQHQQQTPSSQQQQQQRLQSPSNSTPIKKRFTGSERNLRGGSGVTSGSGGGGGNDDIPPPLPQRHPSTRNQSFIDHLNNHNDWRRNTPVSDLDYSNSNTSSKLQHIPSSASAGGKSSSTSLSGGSNSSSSNKNKRQKPKTKALSDPKMSTQIFLQMEKNGGGNTRIGDNVGSTNNSGVRIDSGNSGSGGGCGGGDGTDSSIPPPLPPRQPGMLEENQNMINNSKLTGGNHQSHQQHHSHHQHNSSRPLPNSVDTLMNYPLVATCTAVRDNMSAAFPLSQRPNIVQQLQQHQQHQQQQQQQQQQQFHHYHHNLSSPHHSSSVNKSAALGQTPQNMNHFNKHRRVVSSPEHMHPRHERHLDRHNKSSSGSWELMEKDNEATPPGTPPPPYLSSHLTQSQTLHTNDDNDNNFIENSTPPTTTTTVTTTVTATTTIPPIVIGSPKNSSSTLFPNQILAAQPNTIQKEIISMEDEEISDQECIVDEHGPFNYFQRLLEQENITHLAVFLNYVLSNSDPSPLLFYLITGLYKEGTVKDMRKWAYEIHSTFLVPCAPLLWFNIDESLAHEVDNVLQNEYDKVEILRKVFWKSRRKAKEKICDQLREFQQKRTAGLGTIYGPSDQQLSDAKGDKTKEQKIFEETLLPKLQHLVEELDKEAPVECPKKLALCSALSTVLHRIFVTRPTPGSPIDRVHHFVSREKSFKSRLIGKSRKIVVRGHPLVLRQYYEVTHCNHCQTIIWGVSPQGYHCTDCKLNIHRPCSKVLEESCPGPVPQKRKEQHTDNKISKFMEKIRPTHHFIQNERSRRMEEEVNAADDFSHIDRPHSTSVVRQPSDRRPDLASTSFSSSGTTSQNTSDLTPSHGSFDTDSNALVATENDSKRERSKSKSAPVSVNRSESYKERLSHKRNRTNRRKTSDPSLSKTNDEQSEMGLSNANYTASSSSSLSSSSLESPSTSLEQVGGLPPPSSGNSGHTGPGPGGQHHHNQHQHHGHHHHHHHPHHPTITTATGTVPVPRQWVDSEDETDFTEIDWGSNLPAEILQSLSDAEKKRQEIINEIYQTERNHVRTLRLLEGLFLRPLQESGVLSNDHLQILFPPALFSLKELHGAFEQKLKQRRFEHSYIVRNIGDLLLEMFDGKSGDDLRDYSAQFCLRQQIALESLKEKRRKDENLQRLLTKAESHKACRRLQLKDLLPTVMQRLTKYPLLFENLLKITKRVLPDDQFESDSIQKALDSSKKILSDVNQAVKIVEDEHKLQTIQRKLDKSGLDKDEFRNLDLTQYKLIHDGQLTMKKISGVQLHGLLFENMMVLLHKQDDKYFLKYFPNLAAKTDETNKLISPITHFREQTLVRQSAVDKNAFFLIITKTSQMLELRAPSSSECKKWFKHISDAAEQYKPRSKSSHDVVEDPASATLPHSNTKESLETTSERTTAPITASATSTTTPSSVVSSTTDNTSSHHNQLKDRNDSFAKNKSTSEENSYQQDKAVNQDSNSTTTKKSTATPTSATTGTTTASTTTTDEHDKQENHLRPDHDDSGRRDSVYSNNSNDTRTLMQMCPLLEPSEIQISISPAPVAEPVVTPAERLKQLDQMIRERLAEKQQIICDMFRVPNEHFNEIADIASQPEAPKDSTNIALAAFAQVQSLIEVLNEHMKVTTIQEISAVSTAVCDQCHYRNIRSASPATIHSSLAAIGSTNTGTTVLIPNHSDLNQRSQNISNNNSSNSQIGNGGGGSVGGDSSSETIKKDSSLDDTIIQEDDDGYCEIDELRLPSVMPNPLNTSLTISNGQQQHKSSISSSLIQSTPISSSSIPISTSTPELIKRQSTISADSIPEETEQDITNDEQTNQNNSKQISLSSSSAVESAIATANGNNKNDNESKTKTAVENETVTMTTALSDDQKEQQQQQQKGGLDNSLAISEHIEINETYHTTNSLIKTPIFGHHHHHHHHSMDLCGPNRLSHVQSLEPSVPCHLLNGIATALGAQISLLLPKINEREIERERLRRENQRLRELLNSMHENRRVAEEMETPDITESAKKDEDQQNQEIQSMSSSTLQQNDQTTPTPAAESSSTTTTTSAD